VLTGDPFLELDPCTHAFVYSYPKQVHNYPAIAQALPYTMQQSHSPGSSSWASSNFDFLIHTDFSPKSSLSTLSSRTITFSDSYAPPLPQPSNSKSRSAKIFSQPRAVYKVLTSRIVQTTD
jgi:hypothetical protein